MNNRFLYFLLFFCILGCKKDDTIGVDVSARDVVLPVAGGEADVVVSGSVDGWTYSVSDPWLIVRRAGERLTFIADENLAGDERVATVTITYQDEVLQTVKATQPGVSIVGAVSELSFSNAGGTQEVEIVANSAWSVSDQPDWCTASVAGDKLAISAERNLSTGSRSGDIPLSAGEVSATSVVTQQGSAWYESFDMVLVPGGTFTIGAQSADASAANYDARAYTTEAPVHQVEVADFYLARYEVTQEQWEAAMGSNPSTVVGEKLPVTSVSWDDVQEFLEKLNAASGKTYYLPTEAQWEFAARGGAESDGTLFSGSNVLGACGWYYSNSGGSVQEVGQKQANRLGIYDMSGNVREWCQDWFDYYTANPAVDPSGPASGSMKVNRGGSWRTPAVNCRNSYRHIDYPYEASNDLGFRVALAR